MKLMIVESPAKIKKITSILKEIYPNETWIVKATAGHMNGLAKIKDYFTFEAEWEIDSDKRKLIKDLKEVVAKASEVYLASDPDREGEAIAYHTINILKLKNYKRVTFNEISDKAIKAGIENWRRLDIHLIEAQMTRRKLDFIYGMDLSKLVSRVNPKFISVGRVQSPTVKLVVDREKEIKNFVSTQFPSFEFTYQEKSYIPFAQGDPEDKDSKFDVSVLAIEDAEEIFETLKSIKPTVYSIEYSNSNSNPPTPLNTMDVQQLGFKNGFSLSEVDALLQQLHVKGCVTYIRTDSTHLNPEWVEEARKWLTQQEAFKDIVGSEVLKSGQKIVNAAEAHEAIRPVHIEEEAPAELNQNEQLLYKLIRNHTIACMLKPGTDSKCEVILQADDYFLKGSFTKTIELGHRQFTDKDLEKVIKVDDTNLEEEQEVEGQWNFEVKKTTAPSRFTMASLIKEDEKHGLGRPSTYSSISRIIEERGYVEIKDGKVIPTSSGMDLIDFTDKFLDVLVQIPYTAELETKLDEITQSKTTEKDVLRGFVKLLGSISSNVKSAFPESFISKGKCSICNSELREIDGKNGKFLSCPNWKDHKK